MMHHAGAISDGEKVRLGKAGAGSFSFGVRLVPGATMSLVHSGAFGLFRAERTCTVAPMNGGTQLVVSEQFRGPLAAVLGQRTPLSGSAVALAQFVVAVKERAELLHRTIFMAGNRPAEPAA